MNRTVYGWGINDAGYKVGGTRRKINGPGCPYYACWLTMLDRCLNSRHERNPSYMKVECCEEWRSFTRFKEWMEAQDWQGKELDKDILGDGTIYSPDACCFVSGYANSFLIRSTESHGRLPTGVRIESTGRFSAKIKKKGKSIYLGTYDNPMEAHAAWCRAKLEAAKDLIAEESLPERVAIALIEKLSGRLALAESDGADELRALLGNELERKP